MDREIAIAQVTRLFDAWKRVFSREAHTNASVVLYDKWCECGSGRDLKTGLPVMGKVFYFNDSTQAGWACVLCKRAAYPDTTPTPC